MFHALVKPVCRNVGGDYSKFGDNFWITFLNFNDFAKKNVWMQWRGFIDFANFYCNKVTNFEFIDSASGFFHFLVVFLLLPSDVLFCSFPFVWVFRWSSWMICSIVNCNCKYLIIHYPQGFSGIIYNTGWGTLPDCLRCSLQVLKEWVMMPPYMSEIDHYTRHYVPYSLRRVCGFFNVPQIHYMCKGLWDGAYGLSSLSEKTRKSNHLQMLLQRQHFLLSYLKTLSVGPAGVWTYGLPLSRPALSQLS